MSDLASPVGSPRASRDSHNMWKKLGRLSGMKVGRKKSQSGLKEEQQWHSLIPCFGKVWLIHGLFVYWLHLQLIFPAQRDESVDFAVSCMLKHLNLAHARRHGDWGSDMGERDSYHHGSFWGNILTHRACRPKNGGFLVWSSGQGDLAKNHYYILNDLNTKWGGLPNGWRNDDTAWHGREGKWAWKWKWTWFISLEELEDPSPLCFMFFFASIAAKRDTTILSKSF
jgi:hypothetical protein